MRKVIATAALTTLAASLTLGSCRPRAAPSPSSA